jgi:hypothetical protein
MHGRPIRQRKRRGRSGYGKGLSSGAVRSRWCRQIVARERIAFAEMRFVGE